MGSLCNILGTHIVFITVTHSQWYSCLGKEMAYLLPCNIVQKAT